MPVLQAYQNSEAEEDNDGTNDTVLCCIMNYVSVKSLVYRVWCHLCNSIFITLYFHLPSKMVLLLVNMVVV